MNKRAVVVGVCAALSSGMVGVQALAQPSNGNPDAVPVAAEVSADAAAGALQVIANADDYMLVGDEAQFLRAEPGQGARVGSFAHPATAKSKRYTIPGRRRRPPMPTAPRPWRRRWPRVPAPPSRS